MPSSEKVKHDFNVKVIDTVKTKGDFNISTVIISRYNHKSNVKITDVVTFKEGFNTVKEIVELYPTKNTFNTVVDITQTVINEFNTIVKTDLLSMIKAILEIEDDSQDTVLNWYIDKSLDDISAYTGIARENLEENANSRMRVLDNYDTDRIPQKTLNFIIADLAIYFYRMRGHEHLNSESIGGGSWSYIIDIPPTIQSRLKPYKKMRKIRVF